MDSPYSEAGRRASQNPARHVTFPDSDMMWLQADLVSHGAVLAAVLAIQEVRSEDDRELASLIIAAKANL